jgi:hypothetical protein
MSSTNYRAPVGRPIPTKRLRGLQSINSKPREVFSVGRMCTHRANLGRFRPDTPIRLINRGLSLLRPSRRFQKAPIIYGLSQTNGICLMYFGMQHAWD